MQTRLSRAAARVGCRTWATTDVHIPAMLHPSGSESSHRGAAARSHSHKGHLAPRTVTRRRARTRTRTTRRRRARTRMTMMTTRRARTRTTRTRATMRLGRPSCLTHHLPHSRHSDLVDLTDCLNDTRRAQMHLARPRPSVGQSEAGSQLVNLSLLSEHL